MATHFSSVPRQGWEICASCTMDELRALQAPLKSNIANNPKPGAR
jgi:hypothetical protein